MEHRNQHLGQTFASAGVATAYEHRPPYPSEVFDLLERLIVDHPRTVLDIGAGDGAIARPLAPRVDRVDAVDISAAMIAAGRQRPGGDHPNLRWIVDAVETAPLSGPYALITAGASLHWMDWEQTMHRLAQALTPHGQLAVVEHGPRDVPWQEDLLPIIKRHSRNPDYDPRFSIVEALQERALFGVTDRADTAPVPFHQPIADYIEQFHSTATLARIHMSDQEASDFDRAVERVVAPWADNDVLTLNITATITWGHPDPLLARSGTE